VTRWLMRAFRAIQDLARQGQVQFTHKAVIEIEEELDITEEVALEILRTITLEDFHERLASDINGEWLYVFKVQTAGYMLYIKLAIRHTCVVISFHEDREL